MSHPFSSIIAPLRAATLVFPLSAPLLAQSTYIWNDDAGNNNWVASGNWNQDPGSGDYPGQRDNNGYVVLRGSKWGSGGTNHFDIDFTTGSSATTFHIADLQISTDGSTDNWRLQDGGQQATLQIGGALETHLDASGNASMDADLYISSTFSSSVDWTTSGNKFVLNGALKGDADTTLFSYQSNGGGLTLKTTGTYGGQISVRNNTLDLDHVDAVKDTTVDLGTGSTLEYIAGTNIGMLTGTQALNLSNTLNVGGNNDSDGYSGVFSGTADLYKKGSGTWTLSGANTHTGRTYVNGGKIRLGTATTLRTTKLWLNVNNGIDLNGKNPTFGGLGGTGSFNLGATSVRIEGAGDIAHLGNISGTGSMTIDREGTQTFGNNATYSGSINVLGGGLEVFGGTLMNAGSLVLDDVTLECSASFTSGRSLGFANGNAAPSLQVASGHNVVWNGLVSGGSGSLILNKTGGGSVRFTNNSNSFDGTLDIKAGSVEVSTSALANATIDLEVNNGLGFTDTNTSVGLLTGSANINLGSDKVLTIGGNDGHGSYTGTISASGSAAFHKEGSGTFTFGGTYNGTALTELNGGVFVLDGDLNTSKLRGFDSQSGTSIEGQGRVASQMLIGGEISPDEPGVGPLGTLRAGSMFLTGPYRCDLDAGSAASDRIITDGVSDLTNADLILNFPNGSPTAPAYVILEYGSLLNSAPFSGVVNLPAGYKIDYAYDDGNDTNQIAIVADTTSPTLDSVTLASNISNPTRAGTIVFDLEFSEPVSGVGANDFNVSFAGSHAAPTISGSGSSYSLQITSVTGDGTMTVGVKNGSGIRDEAQNDLLTPGASGSVVVDNTAPVISLSGSSAETVLEGSTWIDPGATATDNIDGSVPVTTGGDTVDPGTPGTYTITYDAMDSVNNAAIQVTRTVTVITAFSDWIGQQFPGEDDPAIVGLTADPDEDGRPNFMEFAMDGDPNSTAPDGKLRQSIETVGPCTDTVVLTFPVRDGANFSDAVSPSASIDRVVYTVEGSEDLSSWSVDMRVLETAFDGGMPALNEGWSYVSVTAEGSGFCLGDRGSEAFMPTAFQRLRVEQAP